MAEDTISITDIATQGVVIDTPPVALSANVFTDVRNVRFKDGAVRKITGELLLNDIASDLTAPGETFGQVRYFAVWENPNLQPLGCYYIWVVDYNRNNVTVGQKIYIQDHTGTKRDITPSTFADGFSFTTSGWQHTLFTGGFTFIINNGIDKPQYILDTAGNTDITNIVLAELPGWDSYNVEQTIYKDIYLAGNSTVFDLGQIVDFESNIINVTGTDNKSVQAGTPAGTGTPNASDFVPGILPDPAPTVTGNNFQIYTDTTSNTTSIVIGGLSIDDEIIITVESRNPVNVRAGIVESFGNLLVAGDLTEVDSTDATKIIRRLSGVVRTSDLAVPGAVPNNWNPFSAGVSTADEFTLSETNVIQDMKSLQGNMYIYSTDSIHVMRLTGSETIPVQFSPNTDEYGCLSTGAVVEYDGRHFVVGANDIYSFAGNPGNIQTLAGKRIKEYFYNNLNPIHERQLFTLQNHQETEIWICYPTLSSIGGECNEALIWNYRDNTWTIRDLNNVTAGDVGPIKGGGIPSATLAITGNSGNAGYTNRGKKEVQAVTINGNTPKPTSGNAETQQISVYAFPDFTTNLKEVNSITLTGDSGPNTVNTVSTLTYPSSETFIYDRNGVTYLDGGASAIINGDTTIGNISFPAISILGTNYNHGDTITMTQFVAAIRDYINNNNALTDFTASASLNVLTLTSDVPGPRVFSSSTFAVSGSGITTNITPSLVTAGIGVYGISSALSPAISMTITAAAMPGVHSAISETIILEKNLTTQLAMANDIVTKFSAKPVFNGDGSSIYSVAFRSPYQARFTSRIGAEHSPFIITFKTVYSGTDYSETEFGGNITASNSRTIGVDNNLVAPTLTINWPDGITTDSYVLQGTQSDFSVISLISSAINNSSNTNWSAGAAGNTITLLADAVGERTGLFDISITSSGSLPPLFNDGSFTTTITSVGRSAYFVTDRITLTPPEGNPITVNFDNETPWFPGQNTGPPGYFSISEFVSDIEIAEALETAWTDNTYFTLTRVDEVLTFTSVTNKNVTGEFNYTVVPGDTRTGASNPGSWITNSTSSDIATTEGINPIFAKMTRVTITINTVSGPSVIFDRHYGEGPGRLLDPNFTPAANDDTYGDTAYTNNTDYLNAYYDPNKTQDATELAKPNGAVSTMQSALLAVLSEINAFSELIVTPDSTSVPTTIDIDPSQFSSGANYVTALSPVTEVVAASVAPTTTILVAAPEGDTVAATTPTQDTTGSAISTTFDIVRPWGSADINPNKLYPIFSESGYTSGTLFNSIRAADLGYDFAGSAYVSYIERSQLSITPNFDTETLNSIALWADGGTATEVGGDLQRATLQLRARATNNPGEFAYLTTPEDNTQSNAKANKLVVNDFEVASSYKSDVRITGRFLNYRIDDAEADTSSGYSSTNINAWNISGLQLGVMKGGIK